MPSVTTLCFCLFLPTVVVCLGTVSVLAYFLGSVAFLFVFIPVAVALTVSVLLFWALQCYLLFLGGKRLFAYLRRNRAD